MPANVAPLRVVQNADGTGYIAEMTAQDTIALQNLVAALRLLGGLTPTAGRIPIFTGDNAASVVALSANGAFFDCIPKIGGDGVLEIGNMLDFHNTSGETADFYIRLYPDSNRNLFKVPGNNTGQNLMLFDHGNILGGVAQNGGIPTGRLMERGGTVNNRYLRYADGTQICHGYIGSQAQVTDQAPVGWHKYVGNASFPASFSSVPRVAYSMISGSTFYGMVANDAPHSTTATASTYIWSPAQSFVGQAGYIAIGRWFE